MDGEDLGSLLRRIGRLPSDKALDIARGLCAGLAAAHEKGVLHRDLKPANIMLDGRGHVLLTDFGLAGVSEQIDQADVRSGTPAYMAPEQLAGDEVTVRSEIYSLGLVLYEIFTGRQPFEAGSLADLVRVRTNTPLTSPSTFVRDLDPAGLGYLGGGGHPVIGGVVSFSYFTLIAIFLLRWGLVSVAIGIIVSDLIMNLAPTLDTSVWFFGTEIFLFAIPVALAAWALYTAVGGRDCLKLLNAPD